MTPRTGRAHLRCRMLAAVAGFLLVAAPAGPAAAQTSPAPAAGPTAGAGAATPGAATPGAGAPLMETVIPQAPCHPAGADPSPYPLSAYTIDYDEGGFTAVSRKAVGTMTELTFSTVRWVVGVGVWLVQWAFSFGFADRLAAPMAAVAGRYQSAFVVPLLGTALLISAAYGAVQIFRGRVGRGVGEFALSLLLVAVFATWLLSDPRAFLNAAFRITAELAGSVATVGLGPAGSPAGGPVGGTVGCGAPAGSYAIPRLDAAVAPLTGQIEQAFVRQPYELLEWGTPVPAPCRGAADAVLAASPGGDRDQIVTAMDTPGCASLYRFNRDPSSERLAVAILVLAASAILMASLGAVAGSVVMAQVVAVALIGLMPFAALAAALPGSGRSVMWHWGTALARALATIVVMAGFLTFLLLAGDALLQSGQSQSLLVRMAMLNMVALLGFSLRRRLLRAGHRATERVGRRLGQAPPAIPVGTIRQANPTRPAMAARAGPAPAGAPALAVVPGDNGLAGKVASAVAAARQDPSRQRWADNGP